MQFTGIDVLWPELMAEGKEKLLEKMAHYLSLTLSANITFSANFNQIAYFTYRTKGTFSSIPA